MKEIDKAVAIIDSLYTTTSKEWTKQEKKHIFSVFKSAYKNVPAYTSFLKKKNIDAKVVSSTNLDMIPVMSKKEYLRAYPWEDLCNSKELKKQPLVMTCTSGSTGSPFYFPRRSDIDLQSSYVHENFLRSCKITKSTSTLVIDCFGMGVWIGGLITYQAFKHISERGYSLSIITPGINKQEIFHALKNVAPHFDQIILCGYPPFMKDVIDHAKDNGISLSNFSIKIVFAAEGFSEEFRDYIARQVGIKNIYRDIMNVYGSADLGTMASETPLTVLIRRLALKNDGLYLKLFKQSSRLPTLAQYVPGFVSFEEKNGSVYCTGDNVLPLVRYEIGDNGAVLTFDEVVEMCKKEGIDLKKEIINAGITDTVTELPFVCVYERTDFSTKLYGAIIYPEYIKKGLQIEEFQKMITGKFTMFTKFNENQDEYLEVNIELQPGVKETKSLHKQIKESVVKSLSKESAEHKNNITLMPKGRVDPNIVFWSYEHESFFRSGGKQKWVRK